MASFIIKTPGCTPVDAWRLYQRILTCILTGNTDAHLKNFAMLHTVEGLRLTPAYDLVAAALYPEYRTFALAIGGAANLTLDRIKPKHLTTLGKACGLTLEVIGEAVRNSRPAPQSGGESRDRCGEGGRRRAAWYGHS